jgi:hypothetical protein
MSVHSTSGIEKISDQEIDLLSFHEQHAGRLVVDPEYDSSAQCLAFFYG